MRFTSVQLLAAVLVACTIQSFAQERTPTLRESAVDSLGDPLPDAALLRLGTLRFRHPSSACDMQLSPNDTTVVTVGGQELIVWDVATGKEKWRVDTGRLYGAMCYSADGLWLATGAMGGEVTLWDPQTGQVVWDKGQHQSYVYTVSFGHDGRTLVTGGDDGLGYLWDLSPIRAAGADDLEQLIGDLWSKDSQVAYPAMWALATVPDRVVGLLAGLTAELNETQADTAKAEPITIARRATALLAQVGTPQARLLLKGWSSQNPDSPLSQAAAEALQRIK